ncbi:MAG: hypothetical protein E7A50_07925, partial [Clostridiales bacterium]|nr:hypothetical protein [Clostridiales bacterium]
ILLLILCFWLKLIVSEHLSFFIYFCNICLITLHFTQLLIYRQFCQLLVAFVKNPAPFSAPLPDLTFFPGPLAAGPLSQGPQIMPVKKKHRLPSCQGMAVSYWARMGVN